MKSVWFAQMTFQNEKKKKLYEANKKRNDGIIKIKIYFLYEINEF